MKFCFQYDWIRCQCWFIHFSTYSYHTHTHTHTHTYTYLHTHTHIHICTHIYRYIYIYIYILTHTYIYPHRYTNIHIYAHTHTHTHIHTHTHTHTHIYIYIYIYIYINHFLIVIFLHKANCSLLFFNCSSTDFHCHLNKSIVSLLSWFFPLWRKFLSICLSFNTLLSVSFFFPFNGHYFHFNCFFYLFYFHTLFTLVSTR